MVAVWLAETNVAEFKIGRLGIVSTSARRSVVGWKTHIATIIVVPFSTSTAFNSRILFAEHIELGSFFAGGADRRRKS
jgi:hypothetical protein